MSTPIDTILSSIPKLEVLAFAPHPDDAELFCGGTIAELSRTYKTGIIDLTLGESSSKGTPEERKEETKRASGILNLTYRGNLEIPDTAVFKETPLSKEEQLKRVAQVIRKSRPSLVLAPFGETRHPDHKGARELVQEALFYATLKKKYEGYEPHTVPLTLYYMCRSAFSPSVVVDVTSGYQQKLDAIYSYTSQVNRNQGEAETLVSHPLSIHSIESRDAYYGSMIGVMKGEPFFIDGPLPMKDPMAFLGSTGSISRFITP